ncbi:MAG: serine/threonine protein kinase [Myxococcales bacterium]|nr:serine/threonine protein kinase [Myxococcales bacterium]
MKCVKCGNALEAGARFCGGCGTQQPGAVIPQAAVRTGAKTLFQGSAGVPAVKPSEPRPVAATPATPVTARPVAVPDKRGPVSSAMSFAATMAPGSVEMKAIAPPTATPVKAPEKSSTLPVSALPPPAVDGDMTGKLLNNRYLIEAKIGEGGFGAVYRATQTQMNRKVALKVLHAKMAKDPQVVGRFKREAQASSQLRAPHTVQVYDFDQSADGIMYLAMEMLQGRSLHAILGEDGPLSPERMALVMDGIADSLGEAHAQGIVHRDIKPENIFLESRPTPDFVKVLDFGIAKIVSGEGLGASAGPALTAAGQTLGTLEYMSPEQLMGAQLDGRSDLYAVGILSYELLVGQLPFPAKTPGEIITAHLKTMPPPPSTVAPNRGIPPLLDQVILKLLAKKRDDRYKDTAELRVDLARLMRGETGNAAAPPVVVASTQPSRNAPSTDRVAVMAAPGQKPGFGKGTILLVAGLVLAVAAAVVVILLFVVK